MSRHTSHISSVLHLQHYSPSCRQPEQSLKSVLAASLPFTACVTFLCSTRMVPVEARKPVAWWIALLKSQFFGVILFVRYFRCPFTPSVCVCVCDCDAALWSHSSLGVNWTIEMHKTKTKSQTLGVIWHTGILLPLNLSVLIYVTLS